jgi:DNA-binding winged helix-turn-helix (wHTH) protein
MHCDDHGFSLAPPFCGHRLERFFAGERVQLERKPLEILRDLLRHAGDLVSKDELLVAIWAGRILSETVIAKTVSHIPEVLLDED